MDRLLNNSQDDQQEDNAPPTRQSQTETNAGADAQALPHLATQLATASSAGSTASLGLQMLSVSAPAPVAAVPPRLPPISLLTAAAAALQPMQCHPLQPRQQPTQPQLRPMAVAAASTSLQPVASSSEQRPQPTDDMLCRYRNKKCGYPRAIKRNGDRHNLCERHRAKANQNQRKLESKRRNQKRMLARVMAAQPGADRVVKAKKVGPSAETDMKFSLCGGQVA
ncbi:hypothetical protein PHYBOEH_001424 [Phytophthora boehmeriae]|uniref:Uncharacterized protein n=1 Tax=Phytophthora boehmeriae TaxID=109152 RepID=A0A8T1X5G4_9STRA|nr:hypothetical protein PHYBOEH_001424 [Phytophthora boehmeriae]